jgi:hypothetical protein
MTHKEFYCLNEIVGDYDGYKVEELGESELSELNNHRAEVAFYWYGSGSYEGSGELIFLREGKWHLCDLGHCSCYGPEERIRDYVGEGYSNFDDLLKACTNEYKKQVNPLIDLIKSKGYGPAKPDELYIGIL